MNNSIIFSSVNDVDCEVGNGLNLFDESNPITKKMKTYKTINILLCLVMVLLAIVVKAEEAQVNRHESQLSNHGEYPNSKDKTINCSQKIKKPEKQLEEWSFFYQDCLKNRNNISDNLLTETSEKYFYNLYLGKGAIPPIDALIDFLEITRSEKSQIRRSCELMKIAFDHQLNNPEKIKRLKELQKYFSFCEEKYKTETISYRSFFAFTIATAIIIISLIFFNLIKRNFGYKYKRSKPLVFEETIYSKPTFEIVQNNKEEVEYGDENEPWGSEIKLTSETVGNDKENVEQENDSDVSETKLTSDTIGNDKENVEHGYENEPRVSEKNFTQNFRSRHIERKKISLDWQKINTIVSIIMLILGMIIAVVVINLRGE